MQRQRLSARHQIARRPTSAAARTRGAPRVGEARRIEVLMLRVRDGAVQVARADHRDVLQRGGHLIDETLPRSRASGASVRIEIEAGRGLRLM